MKEFIAKKGGAMKAGSEYSVDTPGTFSDALKANGFIEEIPEQPKTVSDLKDGDKCYTINHGCFDGANLLYAKEIKWSGSYEEARNMGLIFLTKIECDNYIARRKAKVILERDTKGFRANPKKGNLGWGISYDFNNSYFKGHLAIDCCSWLDGTIRFATKDDAEESIKNHEKEWKTYLGVEE